MTQRILAAVLCLCLLLGGLGFRAEAADVIASGSCGDSVKWTLDSDGVLTIRGSGKMYSNLVCAPWYSQRESIRSVVIEQAVTSIGYRAFYGCTSLTSITIPEGVTRIENSAFYGCSRLASLFFNGDAPTIDTTAFIDVNAVAFYPAGNATWESKKLDYGGTLYWSAMELNTEIIATSICGENMMWQLSKGGVLTIKGSGTFKDFTLWESYKPMIQQIIFSAAIEVPTIPANSFYRYQLLRTITLPDSVTSIGDYAFSGCSSLTSITIPKGVTSIGYWAFECCTSLTSITIPDSVTSIGDSAFYGCTSLTGIWVGKCNPNYSNDENGVLYNKEKTRLIQCPGGLSGTYAIPDSVTSIRNWAFYGCSSLTSITLPDSVTSIGRCAFYGCSGLTSITLPDSVTSIGDSAFYGCLSLTSITIPNGVTSIGYRAFSGCSSLTSITIPNSVTSIGNSAFYGCNSLTSITIPEGVTSIGGDAFRYCTSLTSITIPKSVTSIGNRAFMDCTSLTSVTIPDGVTSIGDYAFSGCSSLTSITIPKSVTSIGDKAFGSCNSLKVVAFLGEKPSINSSAFAGVAADAYYPESLDSDSSWKKSGALSGYGGILNWKPWYTLGDNLFCEHVLEDTVVPPNCTWGYTLHKCACGYSYRTDFEPGSGHDMITDAAVPATCTETGLTEGSHCSRCDYKIAQEVTPALGHDFIDHEAKAATCTEIGWEAYQTCSRCDYTTYKEIPVKGHAPAAPVRENEVAPTCTVGGSYDEVVYCSVCKKELSREAKKLDALGHDFIDHEAKAATCTEIGWEAYQTCSRCDYTTYKEISALGHNWGEPVYDWADDHSAITATRVCKRDPDHTETETGVVTSAVTKEATYDAEGEITYTAAFTNPAFEPQTAVVSLPRLERPDPTPAENPFTDIRESAYYHDPVLWAVANTVTNGTSDSTFSPDEGCTRAQVVTFLWRAAGKPAPASSESPFSDVKEGAYYYNAVLWAVENGITNGTSDTTFSPDETCTRAQIVTFLWRYEEQPAPAGTSNPFADVKPSAYFGSAVLWAVEKGITNGTSATTFAPEDTCTRAQVVTFLYRDIVKS